MVHLPRLRRTQIAVARARAPDLRRPAEVARFVERAQEKFLAVRDERLARLAEVTPHMKLVKFMAWEARLKDEMTTFRNRERRFLRKYFFLNTISSSVWTCTPAFVAVASFSLFVLWLTYLVLQPSEKVWST